MKILDKLFVSFSAGQSSAFMAKKLKEEFSHIYDLKFGFANTGEESEKTLIFADRCDREFGLNLVWLEAVVHFGERVGSTYKIVSFNTAARNGEPFEDVIKKYGIPNKAYPHCTRELKLAPMRTWLNSIGWTVGTHLTAVGIRADEPKRLRKDADKVGIVYPMAHWFPMTKPEINDFWEQQPFRLGLQEHQGNCKWCWKKSFKKLVTIAKETPSFFDFPARMEATYGLNGHNIDGNKRKFFRGHMSATELLQIANTVPAVPTADDPDEFSSCSESCEAFGEVA